MDEGRAEMAIVPWWWDIWAEPDSDLGGFWNITADLPEQERGDFSPATSGAISYLKDSIGVAVHVRNTKGGRSWVQGTCGEQGVTPGGGWIRCVMPAGHIEVPHFGIGMDEYRDGWRPIVERVEMGSGSGRSTDV